MKRKLTPEELLARQVEGGRTGASRRWGKYPRAVNMGDLSDAQRGIVWGVIREERAKNEAKEPDVPLTGLIGSLVIDTHGSTDPAKWTATPRPRR